MTIHFVALNIVAHCTLLSRLRSIQSVYSIRVFNSLIMYLHHFICKRTLALFDSS
ncbi:hypothetical protein HMPREF1578_00654 [Gardnerella pickettii JCP8017B]|nr:hypothetical protein HMPREF1578_00654 [Gardnerella pickettii JCP8017B]